MGFRSLCCACVAGLYGRYTRRIGHLNDLKAVPEQWEERRKARRSRRRLLSSTALFTHTMGEYSSHLDIPYADAVSSRQALDLFLPLESGSSSPLLVFIHGPFSLPCGLPDALLTAD